MRVRRALLLALAAAATAAGAPEDTAPLLSAVARTPALESARRRIDAAQARAGAAGRLPDPEVEAMASRVNSGAMGDDRSMWEFNLRQPLPRRGERAADRERATAAVTMAEAELAMVAGDTAADAAMALAEAEGARARVTLLKTQRNRLGTALASLDARLAAGATVKLADRLTLQSRIAALELLLEETRRSAADAEAAARMHLALASETPLPSFAAPEISTIRADGSPAVTLAEARAAEALATGRMARAGANPMTAVGIRLEREGGGSSAQDTIGLAVSSEIPWRSRGYARAGSRAAEAERAAAQAEGETARRRVANATGRAERAEQLASVARKLAADTRTRLETEHEILSRTVSVGAPTGMGGDSAVLHAVDILERTSETQLRIVEAETTARVARAELWRHVAARKLLDSATRPVSPP
jgi:cobalt-zinc-cadmium efflux system outer membrane protein